MKTKKISKTTEPALTKKVKEESYSLKVLPLQRNRSISSSICPMKNKTKRSL